MSLHIVDGLKSAVSLGVGRGGRDLSVIGGLSRPNLKTQKPCALCAG